MNKTTYYAIWTVLITAMGLIFLFAFWMIYPYKPLVFNSKFSFGNKIFRQGGVLWYTSDYCKYTNSSTIVSRSFVNGIIFTTPTITTARPKGCNKIVLGIDIPKELPVGTYHLENTYSYKVNPLRTVIVKQKSDNFQIIESQATEELRLQPY